MERSRPPANPNLKSRLHRPASATRIATTLHQLHIQQTLQPRIITGRAKKIMLGFFNYLVPNRILVNIVKLLKQELRRNTFIRMVAVLPKLVFFHIRAIFCFESKPPQHPLPSALGLFLNGFDHLLGGMLFHIP
jgi:hypothetical protein